MDEEVISTLNIPGLQSQNNFVSLEELNTVIKEMMQKIDKLILAGIFGRNLKVKLFFCRRMQTSKHYRYDDVHYLSKFFTGLTSSVCIV